MSGLHCRPVHHVKGRAALTRRLRGLLIAVHRYGRHRARTRDEVMWAAQVTDALFQAVRVADPGTLTDRRDDH